MAVNPVTAIIEGANLLIDRLVPDRNKGQELKHELENLVKRHQHEANLAQIAVNKVEAASKFLWVAGWRPAVGWVCAVALANNYILVPYVSAFGGVSVPALDVAQLIGLLTTLLGSQVIRSWDKKNGVAQ